MPGILQSRPLLGYLAGNLASIAGTWGQRVVVFWMAWELTGSTAVLGVLAALDLMPSVLVAPLAGAMADRRPAFRLTRNVQALSALPPLLMIAVVLFGQVNLPVLMVLSLVSGVLNGLDHPLRLWLVGSIVRRELVSKAVAANSIVFNIGRMVGPAVGGWAVSSGTPALIFAGNAVSFLLFAAVIARLAPPAGKASAGAGQDTTQPVAGWRTTFSSFDPPLFLVFALFAAIAALIRPVFELLPGFAEDLASEALEAARVFSFLTASQGGGAMLGALAASYLLARMQYQASAIAAGTASALATLAFLGATQFHVALASLAVMAGAILANGIATQVALQTQLPEAVRGRALSLYTMTFRGAPALGALLVGALGDLAPLRLIAALLAFLMLGCCLLAFAVARRRGWYVSPP